MTSPQTILKAWNLRARKELGQNFLREPTLAENIVNLAAIGCQDLVLEIGAGLGAMTIPAARRARRVIAVEKDRLLVPLLQAELLAQGLQHVQVMEANILALDLNRLAEQEGQAFVVIGNLPYNISSQVMVKLITERRSVRRAVLMFQKELADRLCAAPGNRTYGRLSVLLQYCAEMKVLREIKAEMFYPKPKVGSTVLQIDFKARIEPQVSDEALMIRVVQAAFGQRRKTLRNALAGGLLPLGGDGAAAVLEAAAIDPQRRAETLSVADFVRLTDAVGRYLVRPDRQA
ncbi:16S rRNA (adenine(1518)-N(6)/adenine(1519)-N(6))-dimethyltransferase RsmA [Desulfatitalea tepidiphila]|uniref:16S rRNA (adenine(1518)-N(6)/adenine(1519)-N(6))- dimethyltransferase RsmA n=1 Tax=Desulfatitalea tepidiphila TaxID=1185843 RepID=UPI0006B44375|nr:16S rRNA (adenine(1518)-N(6)/adenine(1519)-N(6))-dimethyltransferase RsmA [Desulfatitalea tepidiphila]